MTTIQRQILDAVVARLRASPVIVTRPSERTRIAHRTQVTRAESPAIHVRPQTDAPVGTKDCVERRLAFEVAIFGRDDGGVDSIDELMVAVMARIKPARGDAIAYPSGTRIDPGAITFTEEDADEDVAFASLAFVATYPAASWSLDA